LFSLGDLKFEFEYIFNEYYKERKQDSLFLSERCSMWPLPFQAFARAL